MDSEIDARLSKIETRVDDLTFSVQQLTSLVDGGTKVISSGSNTRAPKIAHETMPILQTLGDAATKIFTSTIDIPDFVGQVDDEIFIHAPDTGVDIIIRGDPPMVQDAREAITPIVEITNQATTPMLEEINQVATPMLEEIDGVVNLIIGA
ncbi:hypothetical protein PVL29_022909 [Vitis rotundifolia]|uniref:Uncharacterized protein n=1 Tax=Vitis rotundifolia TaxID=103349 RepID=A0AA38YWU2_VITRO|nr:hypothetical protein PVL29_022909 [Vitis rotundifolia]